MQDPHFSKTYPIRFSQCDPAGIVYFPQYLVISNWLVEDWFTEGLGISFSEMIGPRQLGLPLVKLGCEFMAPSRQGDPLTMELRVNRLGRRSLTLDIEGHVRGAVRMRSQQVMVQTSLADGGSADMPDDIRRALAALRTAEEAAA
ncbi:acyl-CoA thioesterase [Chromobacterium alticapitis]|uniref:Acyl-CoA thioesterase n=1 Tax=Chromobacterium alticapitis TaxID=2073169 RepID=A0A2S5DJK0_9NEIS|nr:thioesterase family protein [Chromobacterium alticapitis]POZ63217.1 acyl-CoA thioesterase [Chromobacterium alticapitis]